MVFDTNENARTKEYARMMGVQLALQEDAYNKLGERIAEAKAARHDMRHHLFAIEGFVQSENLDRLREYLHELGCMLPEEAELAICENYAANAIVLHYINQAKAQGILVTTDMQLPQDIDIPGADLCIILGNCLENALESCLRMRDGQKFISVKSALRGNMLIILVDNSFEGPISPSGEGFLSSKRSGPGIGVASVKAVAQKHHGNARFEYSDGVFRVSVMLQAAS